MRDGKSGKISVVCGFPRLAACRVERFRPKSAVVDILEGHRHLLAGAIDGDVSEELQPFARRQVLALLLARRLHENKLRAEGLVERVGPETARMDGAADEFPEGIEVLERGL